MFYFYASIFFLVVLMVSAISLNIVRKKHLNDPLYQQRMEERVEEAKRKKADDDMLDTYMFQVDEDTNFNEQ